MKTSLRFFQFIFSLLLVTAFGYAQGQVVISQVYGGGGNSGATYTHDYVELFNRGEEAVNIGGWTIQYASAGGSSWTNHTVLPDFELQPGQYYLIQQGQGAGGTDALPDPDLIPETPINMGATNFKILLANDDVILEGENPESESIMDFAGFGSANAYEGSAGPALSNTKAGFRLENGCQDTDNNADDFITGDPAPRNSGSDFNVCGGEEPVEIDYVAVTAESGPPYEITVDNGTLQVYAEVIPAEANQAVIWSYAGGTGFATVDENGLVTAVSDGVVIIRATSVADPTKHGDIDIIVSNQVEDIEVSIEVEGGAAAEITTDGGSLQLVATVTPEETSQEVLWTVESGDDFASVDEDGLVTAIANGTVVVRATSVEDETAYDEISIDISGQPVDVASVTVTTDGGVPATITTEGGTLQLIATVGPEGANQEVIWSVEAGDDFATVDANGLVTALDNGTVTARATSVEDETVYGEIDVVISNQPVAVESVSVTTQGGVAALITTENGTLQLVASVSPAEANQQVSWSVESGSSVLSVNQSGLVTAIANGIATVRATSVENSSIYGEIEVEVDIVNAIDEASLFSIVLFPNPAEDMLFISSAERIARVNIYNTLGQEVLNVSESAQVDLSRLESGVYTVRVVKANGEFALSRIVKR